MGIGIGSVILLDLVHSVDRIFTRPLHILLFLCVFSAPFLGRALLSGCISARNICLFRAISGGSAPTYFCSLKCANYSFFCICPLDFCSLCGFCSLCAPDTTFCALCTALVAVVFTAFTTSRFMCWVFRCHCACLCEAYIYLVFCLYDITIRYYSTTFYVVS